MMTSQEVGNAGNSSSLKTNPVIDRITLKEHFDISEEFGFVSESPLTELPEYFKPWNDVALNLQELVKQKRLRNEVDKLPLLDHNKLSSKAEWEAAHMFLAYITQGYVWQDGEEGIPKVLPKAVAVPFHAVSLHLQMPANINQFNSVLVNWKYKDKLVRPSLCSENLETILTLAGGREEQWFFITAMMVEKECGAALYAIADAQQAVSYQDDIKLKESLMVIEGAVLKMAKQLKRTGDGLTPDVFYNVIRPFISGWGAPAFKRKGLEGLIYEGVSDKPLLYTGGTAAESSTLPALDAALGISHKDSEEQLLKHFKKYMPPKHVDFITAVAKGPSIRKYVRCREGSDVEIAYNKCLEAVKLFRNIHLQIVTRFIVVPSRKDTKGTGNGMVGTGGTGFMGFLKGLRDSTVDAFLGQRSSTPTPRSSVWKNVSIAAVLGVTGIITAALVQRIYQREFISSF